ncbi:gamma-glutamyl-gamma-aminobutyrate hydrolase family protein [Acidisoma sp. L85]|jgi:putative glutamine amidotransferase|uniref:gamma-glutamyl-gamma-aminobutyrate hydrolase family protein n=1 Tax=Acidisoma sp. L85 TaxID=1641850 RepID=UPI00131E4133|nr:gamma-glutamyl-gamma-aminobutyrate hydrolase family protein [Acidisoma sp. L85]
MTAFIGISCCRKEFEPSEALAHAASDTYVQAVSDIIGAFPLLIPANGAGGDVERLLGLFDGIILTGSYSNIGPGHYGAEPHDTETHEDPQRDGVTLPLIRAAIQHAVPILGICRGFQELNVALGGTLHQSLCSVAGKMDHWTPLQSLALLRNAKTHSVQVTPGGWLHSLAGASEILVNSHHNQGIERLAPSLLAEAVANDGTIEAARVSGALGFAVGVQWHPEYDMYTDDVSRRIFESFGSAVAAHRDVRAAGC